MRLVFEIESELGALAMLRQKFSCCAWKVTDLVTLVHMLLQAGGVSADYMALGDEMLRRDLKPFLKAARQFLENVPD
jgi:hypothetical protein